MIQLALERKKEKQEKELNSMSDTAPNTDSYAGQKLGFKKGDRGEATR